MGGAAAEDAVTADLLRHLDGDAPLTFVDKDDGYDADHRQSAEDQQRHDDQAGREAL